VFGPRGIPRVSLLGAHLLVERLWRVFSFCADRWRERPPVVPFRAKLEECRDRAAALHLHTTSQRLRGFVFTLRVARCGRSAGCVLCALWAVSAAVLGGGDPVRVSISSSAQHTHNKQAHTGTHTHTRNKQTHTGTQAHTDTQQTDTHRHTGTYRHTQQTDKHRHTGTHTVRERAATLHLHTTSQLNTHTTDIRGRHAHININIHEYTYINIYIYIYI